MTIKQGEKYIWRGLKVTVVSIAGTRAWVSWKGKCPGCDETAYASVEELKPIPGEINEQLPPPRTQC